MNKKNLVLGAMMAGLVAGSVQLAVAEENSMSAKDEAAPAAAPAADAAAPKAKKSHGKAKKHKGKKADKSACSGPNGCDGSHK